MVLACQPSDLKTEHLGASVVVASLGDSVQVLVYYNLRSADSAKFVVSSTNGQPTVSRIAKATAGTLSFVLLGPAEGATDTITVTPTAYKAGQVFNQPAIQKIYKRGVTPPGNVIDSVAAKEAILESKLLDTALVALTTGEECPAEVRDYHGAMLITPHGTQSQNCNDAFSGPVMQDNLRSLSVVFNSSYPWTAKRDSTWRAEVPTVSLPKIFVRTEYIPNPMSGDTLVFGSGSDVNISIAEYRTRHPNFQWGS